MCDLARDHDKIRQERGNKKNKYTRRERVSRCCSPDKDCSAARCCRNCAHSAPRCDERRLLCLRLVHAYGPSTRLSSSSIELSWSAMINSRLLARFIWPYAVGPQSPSRIVTLSAYVSLMSAQAAAVPARRNKIDRLNDSSICAFRVAFRNTADTRYRQTRQSPHASICYFLQVDLS